MFGTTNVVPKLLLAATFFLAGAFFFIVIGFPSLLECKSYTFLLGYLLRNMQMRDSPIDAT